MKFDRHAALRKRLVSAMAVTLVAGWGAETSAGAVAAAEQRPAQSQAIATGAASTVPLAVRRLVQKFTGDVQGEYCSGDGFRAAGVASIGHRADFNGDGVMDYILSPQSLECSFEGSPAFSVYGPLRMWGLARSQGSNFILETFEHADGLDEAPPVRTVNGRPALILSHAGPGAYERPFWSFAWGWNGSAMAELAYYDANDRRVNRDGSPWRPAGPQQPAAASVKFPPVPKGYYAVGMSCARAVASDDPFTLWFFDETKMRSGMDEQEILGFETLGNNRYRIRARIYDEGGGSDLIEGTIRVTGPSSFAEEGPDGKLYPHIHCPATMVPRDKRAWYEE